MDANVVVIIEDAVEILRTYCPDCTPQQAYNTLVANNWEVTQIHTDLHKRGLQMRCLHLHGRDTVPVLQMDQRTPFQPGALGSFTDLLFMFC